MTTTAPEAGRSPAPERPRRPGRRPLTLRRRESRAGLALVTPTLLVVVAVIGIPIVWTVVLAFQRVRLATLRKTGLFGELTLDNIDRVLHTPGFADTLWTTVLYSVGGTAGSIVVGLAAALAVRGPFRGRTLVRASMLLPYVAPVVAMTFVWQVMLDPQLGIVNDWGKRFLGWDQPVPFLSQESTALWTVIAFEAWRYFPFAFLFLLARLQAVPGELEEAARVDGATPTQRFRHILLPQLMPVIALIGVLRFIMTFNKFDDVYLLTGGAAGTEVVSVRVYQFLTARTDIGAAAAQAVVLAVVLLVFVAIYLRFFGARREA
ncbi:sugar ABC transporter permease [Micromonospora tulbaghiae]|uniref:Carbohydrate ABC transporter membrane protein 1, CUT1 family n=1 Tax=Micromonospora tulbaghiae TaxID=479978 RepID=A0AAW4JAV9_9ACTN|nr:MULTISPECIES: sugar ABC transporter permease [Micromonospora]KAB1909583.1 sugar ABC transporter permease [Micromonospora sp. AMSO1212t]MBO4138978.1 sugar ABC transporter permease [Micromonospora tulbaghiae]MDX5459791.1 sugar ABC transporter permease [Micromonospora tulbaghiae]SCF12888.1 carbohydrate ABC transporter membrane protein 1, CUT1 family [Micromonospora tulbaghiae]